MKNSNTVKPGRVVSLTLLGLAGLGARLAVWLAQLGREQGRRATRQARAGCGLGFGP
jgi:hypothetical protein